MKTSDEKPRADAADQLLALIRDYRVDLECAGRIRLMDAAQAVVSQLRKAQKELDEHCGVCCYGGAPCVEHEDETGEGMP